MAQESEGTVSTTVVGIPAKIVWQLQMLAGLITMVLGVILAFHPSKSLDVIAVFIGILLILSGLFHFVRALDHDEQHRAWVGIAGLLEVVIGVVMIRHLGLSYAIVGLLVGVTWIVQGIVALMGGILSGAGSSRLWAIVFGLISIVAGVVVVSAPENSLTFLATLLGVWFIIMGVLQLLSGLFLRSDLKKLA
ncbi:MAG: DUF308 domain-containing protein [Actinomycetes bacterium]